MRILKCSEVSELASQALDRKLGWRERFGLYMHLLLCKPCVQFRRQISFLRRAASTLPEDHSPRPDAKLAPSARDRIRTRLGSDPH
ncbi:MAG: anti-sigma factor [Gammaproteobacteria bacterium]|nr:anti-sigma factor [Gammaproteobacteria bacterium]